MGSSALHVVRATVSHALRGVVEVLKSLAGLLLALAMSQLSALSVQAEEQHFKAEPNGQITWIMTSFGATPALSPWQWSVAADLANIPRLSESQQRVGKHGTKQEDLNKSDVYGRLRISVGLPGEFVATLGWTPPLSYGGVQPLDLFAFSLGRRLFERDAFSVSMQLVGQHAPPRACRGKKKPTEAALPSVRPAKRYIALILL